VCGGGGTGVAGSGRRDATPAAVRNDAAGCVRYQTDEGGGAFEGGLSAQGSGAAVADGGLAATGARAGWSCGGIGAMGR
jgi:hypothetical protein